MNKKTEQLLALWGTITLLLLLAVTLSNLVLVDRQGDTPGFSVLRSDGSINPMPLVILGLIILILVGLILWRQQSQRNPYFAILLVLFMGVVAVFLIIYTDSREPILMSGTEILPGEPEMPISEAGQGEPQPEVEGEVVEVDLEQPWLDWVSLIVGILLALVFMSIIAVLIWQFANTEPDTRPVNVDESLTELAQQAQAAIKALRQGQTLKEVVLRCYVDMERVLATTQGIQRRQTMTAREFEQQLIQLGLPAQPVKELTRLFETVRYGLYTPQADDEAQAVDSLTLIVAACEALPSTIGMDE